MTEIEFRWLVVSSEVVDGIPWYDGQLDEFYSRFAPKKSLKLQFRENILTAGAGGYEDIKGDWRDVPIVDEP